MDYKVIFCPFTSDNNCNPKCLFFNNLIEYSDENAHICNIMTTTNIIKGFSIDFVNKNTKPTEYLNNIIEKLDSIESNTNN